MKMFILQDLVPGLKNPRHKKHFFFIFFLSIISFSLHSQLAVAKMIGKNSKHSHLGFEAFTFYAFPTNEIGNRNVIIELIDFAYFDPKSYHQGYILGYLSIKAGFRYIFSEETKTGFYIEPQLGYCVVTLDPPADPDHGNGVAIAAIGGYNLEVGQRGNSLNLGLKYEIDLAGVDRTVSSIGLRFSYSFGLFRKIRED